MCINFCGYILLLVPATSSASEYEFKKLKNIFLDARLYFNNAIVKFYLTQPNGQNIVKLCSTFFYKISCTYTSVSNKQYCILIPKKYQQNEIQNYNYSFLYNIFWTYSKWLLLLIVTKLTSNLPNVI